MARVPLFISVADPATGSAIAGATATVKHRVSGANATLYAGETGATTAANPLVTDATGRAQAFVDRAPLRIDYAGGGLTAFTENRDIGPSTDRGIDTLLLPQGALPDLVATLPVSPVDGAEVYFLADAALGILWHLRYRAASASAYKWEAVSAGGQSSGTIAEVTQGGASSGAFFSVGADVTVTPPLAGDYRIAANAHLIVGSAGTQDKLMGLRIGATEATATEAAYHNDGLWGALAFNRTLAGLAANTALMLRFMQTTGAAQTVIRRATSLLATPIRVG